MKVAFVGSRHFVRLDLVEARVDGLPRGATVVSGGASGVDRTAEIAARKRGLRVVSFRPARVLLWQAPSPILVVKRHVLCPIESEEVVLGVERGGFQSYGQAAYARNRLIVQEADLVLAFWDGKSKGTKHSIDLAHELDKPVTVIEWRAAP